MSLIRRVILLSFLFATVVRADPHALSALVNGNRQFAIDLYRQLAQDDAALFFSPHSISVALAMTYAGAREQTEIQMSDALHFPFGQDILHPIFGELDQTLQSIQSSGNIQLYTANSIWPQERIPLQPEFIEIVRTFYRSDVYPVDFSQVEDVRLRINGWVESKTQEKIKDLIPPGFLSSLTRMVLVNAVYFKGDWQTSFSKALTRKMPFYRLKDKMIQLDTMQGKIPARYADVDDLQVMELSYKGGDVVMTLILPKDRNGLAAIESSLTIETLAGWESALSHQEVMVFLPRINLTAQFSLGQVLRQMGMVIPFDMANANFSGMDGRDRNLYISEVVHKAFVDVNEEGTEAAAATGVIMATRSMMPKPVPEFRADHPFLFFIQDQSTRSLLFMGRFTGDGAGE